MSKGLAAGAIIVVAGLLGGLTYATYFNKPVDKFAACRTSKIAGGAGAIGGPFTLVDENGKTVTDKDVITGPTLIYFGYTFCPDVCPLDNARNAEAVTLLEDRGIMVKPVFISIDPARDTPEALRDFTDILHPRMLGLTGTPEQVKAASKAYHTYYKKQEDGDPEYYLMDHSTYTYLMFPKDGFVEFYDRNVTPEQMADSVECFTKAAE